LSPNLVQSEQNLHIFQISFGKVYVHNLESWVINIEFNTLCFTHFLKQISHLPPKLCFEYLFIALEEPVSWNINELEAEVIHFDGLVLVELSVFSLLFVQVVDEPPEETND